MTELLTLDLLSLDKSYFIGASDLDQEGAFVWVDGCPLSWNRWFSYSPDNSGGDEHCVEINRSRKWNQYSKYTWNDCSCNL
jgi:hypothetical protein